MLFTSPFTRPTAPLVLAVLLGLALLAAPGAALAAPQESQSQSQSQASSDACAEGGVTLVVDPADLGGDPAVTCVEADGAEQPAPQAFADAGVELTPVDPFPGAVCQVDGEPADAACGAMPPADAYWGLYVADAGGEWDFAPVGIDELDVAEGSFVGFAWQSGGEPTPPAVAPQPGEATPGAQGDDAAASDDAGQESGEEAPDPGGLPWWVPLLVGVAVIVLGVGIAVRRRSRT